VILQEEDEEVETEVEERVEEKSMRVSLFICPHYGVHFTTKGGSYSEYDKKICL